MNYMHKKTNSKIKLIKRFGSVGMFEVNNTEIKRRGIRLGKERIVCLMDNVLEFGNIKLKFRLSSFDAIVYVNDERRKVFLREDGYFFKKKCIRYANDLRKFYLRAGFCVNGKYLNDGGL